MASAHLTPRDDRALVNEWLAYLGGLTRLPFHLDDDGMCTIGHASGLDCAVEVPGDGSLYLRVGILRWEPETYPDMAERCLVAQFMGRETHGASFGVDPVDGQLVLWQERPLGSLDEKSFCLLVARLLESAARWRTDNPAAEEAADRAAAIDAQRPADFSLLKA